MSHTTTQNQNRVIPANLYVVLLAGVLSISSSSILIRFGQAEGLPSLFIAAGRLAISAFILTPWILHRYRPVLGQMTRNDFLLAMGAGTLLALHFATWVTSLEYTTVLVSVVLVTTSPIWVALLEWIVLRLHIPRGVIIGLSIAIAGGVLIGLGGESGADGGGSNILLGGSLALAGAITVAAHWIIGRKLRAKLPVMPYIWLVYGCAAIVLTGFVLISGTPIVGYSLTGYLWLIPMALIPQLIGHSALNYAVGYMPATLVSMITQLEPIGSALLAYIFFMEIPLPLQIVGSGIILAGVMLANLSQSQRKRKS